MLLGFMLSLSFALSTVFITEDYEQLLASEILRGQAEDYSLRLSNGLPAQLPQTHRLSGYLGHPPVRYANFGLGVHEDPLQDGVHVGVFDMPAGRMFFVINLGDIETLEQHLNLALATIVALGTLISGWLGWLLARRALAPVSALAAAVDRLPTTAVATQLAASASPDDLGRLAEAIDRYQGRLVDVREQQKAFFADASHELRTPVAVVQGAAELLREDAVGFSELTPRLDRLDRGIGDLIDLLDVLLRLARGKHDEPEAIEAVDWTRGVVTSALSRFAPDLHIEVAGPATVTWTVSRHEAALLLRAIARDIVPPGASGTLNVSIEPEGLSLSTVGELGTSNARRPRGPVRSDRAVGGGLVGRLAGAHGWRIDAKPGRAHVTWVDSAV
ncbi:histidine kinase dimerization/phospho-acceptor domain-containing protein [Lysobacter sp. TY2-98]|uniref:histidine kinase dimerization/phospho-acceptor domain-containing protein n=1 Tax=Lysobacter sp. TY2-98 TaxID=2290922 RepID=UPI0013B44350|nr:histidine kinase dimerization/phospho-acceptor domain-containing protein [Lysobacter sp. TY2-98]